MEHILRTDPVSYFFWSHNDNRIYSEHPDQVNGSIYYINLQKKVEAYEIRGNLYLKVNWMTTSFMEPGGLV